MRGTPTRRRLGSGWPSPTGRRAPIVYGLTGKVKVEAFQREFVEDTSIIHPLPFFAHGEGYRFWGQVRRQPPSVRRRRGACRALGTDALGRDVFSRVIASSPIGLTIGLVGALINFVLGCILGGVSEYFGGAGPPDPSRHRVPRAIPNTPLWMALTAVIPVNWPVSRV